MNIRRIRVVCLALILDLAVGDPPNRLHLVAWMGRGITAARHCAPTRGCLRPLAYGTLLAAGGTAAMTQLGRLLERAVVRLPAPWDWLAEAMLLKMVFSLRGLVAAASQVEQALEAGDLPEARRLVSWHLVSRDTTTLSQSQVAAATIESIAENTSDSLVAPLLYYAVGGLPGAMAYRFINTTDAMLGYRDPAREWLGKVPARLDDLANLLPARVTAGLIILAAGLAGANPAKAWRIWRRDAGKTTSPNAGHPMSATAGALGVELEKAGHYRLGAGERSPRPGDIRRALKLMRVAAVLAFGFLSWVMARGR
jgi:adenosylcobinamide-phosphate synthase